MPRRSVRAALLVVLLTICSVGAGGAAASTHQNGAALPPLLTVEPPEPSPKPPGFALRSSNGYTVAAYFLTGRDGKTYLWLLVERAGRSVSYLAPALAAGETLEADLGELGRIAVAFHPTGGTRRQRGCSPSDRPFIYAAGYYEGTIDFHGEEGYTGVEATRARGDAKIVDVVCSSIVSGGTDGRGPGVPGAALKVRPVKEPRLGPRLTVVENDPRAPVQIEVNTSEQRGEILIERSVRARAPRTAFDYSPDLRRAILHPPSPFSGAARFRRVGRHGSRWTGNLRVDLPGRVGVSLTKTPVRASLFHARFTEAGPVEQLAQASRQP